MKPFSLVKIQLLPTSWFAGMEIGAHIIAHPNGEYNNGGFYKV